MAILSNLVFLNFPVDAVQRRARPSNHRLLRDCYQDVGSRFREASLSDHGGTWNWNRGDGHCNGQVWLPTGHRSHRR